MKLFYGNSEGRGDISCDAPTEASLETALAVFQDLNPRRGFMGVVLDDRFHVQLLPYRDGVRVELLDTSKPALDACEVGTEFAVSLIRAASVGKDVIQIARQSGYEWEHTDLD